MSEISQKVTRFFTAYPVRVFDKRQIIIRANEDLASVFYVVSGRVSQYDITTTGNEIVLNVFKPGAFFPMSTAINRNTNLYYFEASTSATVHVVPVAKAVQFLRDNPDVTFDLLSRVYRGVDGVLQRMGHLMAGDARSRLVFELLNAAYRFGEYGEMGSVFVSLKETDIARHSGLARETVNRNIQSLKSEGIVSVDHSGITIHNLRLLETSLDEHRTVS